MTQISFILRTSLHNAYIMTLHTTNSLPFQERLINEQSSSSESPTELINGIPNGVIVKISAEYLFPQSNSPQSNLFKFIPQRSHLLLQVYSHNHLRSPSPAETKNPTLFSSSSWIYFPQLKTSHFHTS